MTADVRRTPDGAPVNPADARHELAEELGDMPLSPLEARTVLWLYECEQPTIHAIVTLLRKAKGEAP